MVGPPLGRRHTGGEEAMGIGGIGPQRRSGRGQVSHARGIGAKESGGGTAGRVHLGKGGSRFMGGPDAAYARWSREVRWLARRGGQGAGEVGSSVVGGHEVRGRMQDGQGQVGPGMARAVTCRSLQPGQMMFLPRFGFFFHFESFTCHFLMTRMTILGATLYYSF